MGGGKGLEMATVGQYTLAQSQAALLQGTLPCAVTSGGEMRIQQGVGRIGTKRMRQSES